MPILLLFVMIPLLLLGQPQIREAGIRAELVGKGTEVTVPVLNPGEAKVRGGVWLQYLDARGAVHEAVEREVELQPGENLITVPMPLPPKLSPYATRIRCRAWIGGQRDNTAEEIVEFSRVAAHAFRLLVTSLSSDPDKHIERVRILAMHPSRGTPRAGVDLELEGTMRWTYTRTDENGEATASIAVEPDRRGLKVKGVAGDFKVSTEYGKYDTAQFTAELETDKLSYRPGDTIRVRARLTGPNTRPIPDAEYWFELYGPTSGIRSEAAVRASRFGIVSAELRLPAEAAIGEYRLSLTDGKESIVRGVTDVRVRRTLEEQFEVLVKPDRSYYSVTETATLDLRRVGPTGSPMIGGSFRIGLNGQENQILQGTFDENGSARVQLSAKDLGPYRERYLGFVPPVFWIDATNGAGGLKQRNHFLVHFCGPCTRLSIESRFGKEVVLSAKRPDQTAVEGLAVELLEGEVPFAHGVTDRLGLVKAEVGVRREFKVRAQGLEQVFTIDRESLRPLQLKTDKSLYGEGDSIVVSIESLRGDGPIHVLAVNEEDGTVLSSKWVEIQGGRATTSISYRQGIGPVVRIQAVAAEGKDALAILYVGYLRQKDFPLRIRVMPERQKPKGVVTLEIEGAGMQASYGVAVVDDRFPQDLEQGPQEGRNLDVSERLLAKRVSLLNRRSSIGWTESSGVASPYGEQTSLAANKLRRRLEEELKKGNELPKDVAALESLVGELWREIRDPWGKQFQVAFTATRDVETLELISSGPDKTLNTLDDVRTPLISRSWFESMKTLIQSALQSREEYPVSLGEFQEQLAQKGVHFDRYRDPFGEVVRSQLHLLGANVAIMITSAGPDRKWGSRDDLYLADFRGRYFAGRAKWIEAALKKATRFPQNKDEFLALMWESGIDFEAWRDASGAPLQVAFRQMPRDHLKPRRYSEGAVKEIHLIEVWSGTEPHRSLLAEFLRGEAIIEHWKGQGKLEGRVTENSWAAPQEGLKVVLDDTYSTVTDAEGKYRFEDLPAGTYHLSVWKNAFERSRDVTVEVSPGFLTRLDLTPYRPNEDSRVAPQYPREAYLRNGIPYRDAPRETAFWKSEVVSDLKGHAKVEIRIPDSMTTWKIVVRGSLIDGRIAKASLRYAAQTPIEVGLERLSDLTVGDRVKWRLPIQLDRAQAGTVKIETRTGPGLTILSKNPTSVDLVNGRASLDLEVLATGPSSSNEIVVKAQMGQVVGGGKRQIRVEPSGFGVNLRQTGNRFQLDVAKAAIPASIQAQLYVESSLLAKARPRLESPLTLYWIDIAALVERAYANLRFLEICARGGTRFEGLEQPARINLTLLQKKILEWAERNGSKSYGKTWVSSVSEFMRRAQTANVVLPELGKVFTGAPALPKFENRRGEMTANGMAQVVLQQLARVEVQSLEVLVERIRAQVVDEHLWRKSKLEPSKLWGREGEYETTALVFSALAQFARMKGQDPSKDPLLTKVAQHLIEGLDKDGRWLQMISEAQLAMTLLEVYGPLPSGPFEIPLKVDGVPQKPVVLRSIETAEKVDLGQWFSPGKTTEFELQPAHVKHPVSARLEASWVEAWSGPRVCPECSLDVSYSKTEARVGEPITATVRLKVPLRFGDSTVEVGLPPGCELASTQMGPEEWRRRFVETRNGFEFDHLSRRTEQAEYSFVFVPRLPIDALAKPSRILAKGDRSVIGMIGPARFRIVE